MFQSESRFNRPRAADLMRADVRNAPLAEIEGIKQHIARNLQANTDTFFVREMFHGRVTTVSSTLTALTNARYYIERMREDHTLKTGDLYTQKKDQSLNVYPGTDQRLVVATNLCERTDWDVVGMGGSHLLLAGTSVWVYGVMLNKAVPAFLYFFYREPQRSFTFRLTAVGSGRGKYTGTLYGRRSVTTDVDTTTNVVQADIGSTATADGAISGAIAVNSREVNITTAIPSIAANLLSTSGHPLDFPATLVHINSNGTPVVRIDAVQDSLCS